MEWTYFLGFLALTTVVSVALLGLIDITSAEERKRDSDKRD